MFETKRCRRCNKGLKKDWEFCPYCGERVEYRPKYRDIFEDIEEEFGRLDKMFGPKFSKFPRINIKSPFRTGGVTITIRSGTKKPKVDIKTSGHYKRLEPQIKKRLGVTEGIEGVKEEKPEVRIPKVTEEPETKIEKHGNKENITIKLPDVKNLNDVEIRKLGQSLEIKAFAGDKAYFKLIPTRPNARILDRSFKDGILKIEVTI